MVIVIKMYSFNKPSVFGQFVDKPCYMIIDFVNLLLKYWLMIYWVSFIIYISSRSTLTQTCIFANTNVITTLKWLNVNRRIQADFAKRFAYLYTCWRSIDFWDVEELLNCNSLQIISLTKTKKQNKPPQKKTKTKTPPKKQNKTKNKKYFNTQSLHMIRHVLATSS